MHAHLPSRFIATGFIAAMLLTGCSAQDSDTAESQPSASASSASAAATSPVAASKDASEPANSDASDGADASSSDTALPTLADGKEVTLTDDERADFEAGKYVPATAQHPALNVLEPVMPEAAKEQTFEGAKAFLGYWVEAKNYNIETGKITPAKELVTPNWPEEREMYEAISQEYVAGGWVKGSYAKLEIPDDDFNVVYEGLYDVIIYHSETAGTLYDKNGKVKEEIPAFNESHQPTVATLVYENGHWALDGSSGIAGVEYEN